MSALDDLTMAFSNHEQAEKALATIDTARRAANQLQHNTDRVRKALINKQAAVEDTHAQPRGLQSSD